MENPSIVLALSFMLRLLNLIIDYSLNSIINIIQYDYISKITPLIIKEKKLFFWVVILN